MKKLLLLLGLLGISGCGNESTFSLVQAREICEAGAGPKTDLEWSIVVTGIEIVHNDGVSAAEALAGLLAGCDTLVPSAQADCLECFVALVDAVWN